MKFAFVLLTASFVLLTQTFIATGQIGEDIWSKLPNDQKTKIRVKDYIGNVALLNPGFPAYREQLPPFGVAPSDPAEIVDVAKQYFGRRSPLMVFACNLSEKARGCMGSREVVQGATAC